VGTVEGELPPEDGYFIDKMAWSPAYALAGQVDEAGWLILRQSHGGGESLTIEDRNFPLTFVRQWAGEEFTGGWALMGRVKTKVKSTGYWIEGLLYALGPCPEGATTYVEKTGGNRGYAEAAHITPPTEDFSGRRFCPACWREVKEGFVTAGRVGCTEVKVHPNKKLFHFGQYGTYRLGDKLGEAAAKAYNALTDSQDRALEEILLQYGAIIQCSKQGACDFTGPCEECGHNLDFVLNPVENENE